MFSIQVLRSFSVNLCTIHITHELLSIRKENELNEPNIERRQSYRCFLFKLDSVNVFVSRHSACRFVNFSTFGFVKVDNRVQESLLWFDWMNNRCHILACTRTTNLFLHNCSSRLLKQSRQCELVVRSSQVWHEEGDHRVCGYSWIEWWDMANSI